jgi:hypothetical protein
MLRSVLLTASIAVVLAACVDTESFIRVRAARELQCPPDQMTLVARPDLTPNTYDVNACGRQARYTCARGYYSSSEAICVREPMGP